MRASSTWPQAIAVFLAVVAAAAIAQGLTQDVWAATGVYTLIMIGVGAALCAAQSRRAARAPRRPARTRRRIPRPEDDPWDWSTPGPFLTGDVVWGADGDIPPGEPKWTRA